jgi:hypothetical protein
MRLCLAPTRANPLTRPSGDGWPPSPPRARGRIFIFRSAKKIARWGRYPRRNRNFDGTLINAINAGFALELGADVVISASRRAVGEGELISGVSPLVHLRKAAERPLPAAGLGVFREQTSTYRLRVDSPRGAAGPAGGGEEPQAIARWEKEAGAVTNHEQAAFSRGAPNRVISRMFETCFD